MNAEHYERMEEDEASEDEDMFNIADGKLTFSRVEKVMLLRFFNQAMIKMPNFKKDNDPYRGQLLILLGKCSDPEFILKLSLYGRKHLNVRTASNFLLAYAAMKESCKPFVAKYYASIIVLPSDWLEVAELALIFCKDDNLPNSLREVMAKKFADFDKDQLGTYNNNDTMKKWIRDLQITQPVDIVMCLIGEKYPSSMGAFSQSGLPGSFEQEKAGKRMTLPTPETWETQVSLEGSIPPLPGRTVIFCDVGDRKTNEKICSSSKGLGEPRTIGEMTVLLGLMCEAVCEESRLLVCGSKKFGEIGLDNKDSVMSLIKSVLDLQYALNDDDNYKYLTEFADDLIYRKEKIDRWIVLGGNSEIPGVLSKMLKVYVDHVRWDLKAFNVNLDKDATESSDTTHEVEENDFIDIFGSSEQVLGYIAEECDKGQLTFVENMDKAVEDSEDLQKMRRRPLEISTEVCDDSLSKVQSYPQSTLQQALSEPDDSHVYRDAEQLLLDRPSCRTPCALWMNKHHYQDLCKQTVEAKDASCLALNSVDRLLAVGFETAAIKTFSISSYEVQSTLIGHFGRITSLCFVSDVRLCSASSDGTLILWDIVKGFRIAVMEGHSRSVTSCASDKVGRIIVSVGLDAQIKVWHGRTGKLEHFISRDVKPINCLALHPEGKLLVIGSWDSALKIWDYLEKAKKAVLRGHSGSVQEVKFNKSGDNIASVDIFGEVRIWSSQHGCTLGILKNRSFTGVFYSPDLGELLTSSSDGTVKVLSPTLGRCTAALGDSEHGHATCLTFDPFSETFMPDFVVGYHSGSVRMFSSAAGSMMWERIHKGSPMAVSSIAFHRNNDLTFLIVGRIDGTCEMFSKSGHDNKTIATLTGHDSPLTGVCCYDDIVITSAGKTLNMFILSNYLKLNPNLTVKPFYSCEKHEDTIMAVAKGSYLASVGRDKMIVVWQKYQLSVFKQIKDAHKDWITCCSWSSQDDHLVTGSKDCLLKIWDVRKGEVEYTLEGHVAMVTGVAYRHGCVVSSGSDGSVKVWSHKGVFVSNLKASNVKCNSCDLFVGIKKKEERIKSNRAIWQIRSIFEEAKDSETTVVVVASCYDDGSVKIWNPIEAEERHVLVGHKKEIKAVVAGHRGVVCSVSADGLLKAWSIPSKVPDGSSAENSSAVSCFAVSQDGFLMCCGTRDGFVKLWLQTEFADTYGRARSSVRVSMRQVTNLCFMLDAMLAVSSDDLQLSIWKVVHGSGGDLGLSFFKSVTIDRPTACMAISTVDNFLVTGQRTGSGQVWDVEKMEVHNDWDDPGIDDQVLRNSIKLDNGDIFRQLVFVHGSFINWSWEFIKGEKKGAAQNLPPNTRVASRFRAKDEVVDVREAGDIFDKPEKIDISRFIHGDEITGVAFDGDILFTCSRDGHIKAFNMPLNAMIGQFPTPFILTSMTRICKGHHGVTKLVCGTQSGILIGIEWIVRR